MSQAIHSADEARHQLYEIMKRDAAFGQKAEEALELGRAYLDVEVVDQAHEMSPELTVETVLWELVENAASYAGDAPHANITLTLPRQLAQTVTDSESDPQIERADERYETAFEAAPTGLVVLGGGGEVLEANDRAESLLDCEGSPYAGRPIAAVTDAATGPLAEGRLAAGEGRIDQADQTLDYRLATDVGSGQHLLVVEAKR